MSIYSEQFIALCLQTGVYSKSGVKRHNRAVKELSQLYKVMSANKEEAKTVYDQLMDHDDERVRAAAAAHCLGMNIQIEKAKRTLKRIARGSANPISRFNAQTALDVWKKQKEGCAYDGTESGCGSPRAGGCAGNRFFARRFLRDFPVKIGSFRVVLAAQAERAHAILFLWKPKTARACWK